MDIRQLEIFEAVLATGNMTRAANQLFLSPAAVSLQIRNLSRELGVLLFVRSGGKLLTPTPAALRLGKLADDLLSALARIRHNFESDAEHDIRPLVLATGTTPLLYQLGGPIRRFRRRFPNANLAIRVSSTPDTIRAIQDRQVDIGVVVPPCPAEGIRLEPLYKEELKICVNPRSTAVKGATIKVADLANLPFIFYSRPKSSTRAIIDRFFAELKVEPKVTVELDDTEAIKRLIELGFGASILPAHAVRHKSPLLRALHIEGHRLYRRIALAVAETRYPRNLTETLCVFLCRELAEEAPSPATSPSRHRQTDAGP